MFCAHIGYGQEDVRQPDALDLGRKLFRLKTPANDTLKYVPGKLYFNILGGPGYSILTGFIAVVTGNFAFYTGKSADANVSSVQANLEYSEHNQFMPSIISNIWTPGNKFNILGDYRFYKYSTYTYGLGGNSPTGNPDFFYYDFLRVYEMAMMQILPDLLIGPGFNIDYHWNVRDAGPVPVSQNDYYQYGAASKTISSGITFNMLYDTRRNQINPRGGGYYLNFIFRENLQSLGSDRDWSSVYFDLRKYLELPKGSKNVLAFWNYEWFVISGKSPYFDLPSTGWDTYGNADREYIQGRYRGKGFINFETEYRFNLSRNRMLGFAIFANAQSVSNWPDNFFRTVNPGAGAAFRLKINKHSDSFFVFGYGFGVNGQGGMNFNLGEYF